MFEQVWTGCKIGWWVTFLFEEEVFWKIEYSVTIWRMFGWVGIEIENSVFF